MRSSAGIDRCRAKTRRWRQAAVDADKPGVELVLEAELVREAEAGLELGLRAPCSRSTAPSQPTVKR